MYRRRAHISTGFLSRFEMATYGVADVRRAHRTGHRDLDTECRSILPIPFADTIYLRGVSQLRVTLSIVELLANSLVLLETWIFPREPGDSRQILVQSGLIVKVGDGMEGIYQSCQQKAKIAFYHLRMHTYIHPYIHTLHNRSIGKQLLLTHSKSKSTTTIARVTF